MSAARARRHGQRHWARSMPLARSPAATWNLVGHQRLHLMDTWPCLLRLPQAQLPARARHAGGAVLKGGSSLASPAARCRCSRHAAAVRVMAMSPFDRIDAEMAAMDRQFDALQRQMDRDMDTAFRDIDRCVFRPALRRRPKGRGPSGLLCFGMAACDMHHMHPACGMQHESEVLSTPLGTCTSCCQTPTHMHVCITATSPPQGCGALIPRRAARAAAGGR